MFVKDNSVIIKKGFMTFTKFYNNLRKYKNLWNTSPFVLHFRISTQAGVNPGCTHPFPLSSKMDDLKQLENTCKIGIAHNGIISLTSNHWNKTITYSDTMEFITDYLTLIIKDKNYWKNIKTITLIERLAESKLAILDYTGHCELIGKFVNDDGIYYSNGSYINFTNNIKKEDTKHGSIYYDDYCDFDYDNYDNHYKRYSYIESIVAEDVKPYYDYHLGKYCFDDYCPAELYDVYTYCKDCIYKEKCVTLSECEDYVDYEI